mgnify:CR=1 FL=1
MENRCLPSNGILISVKLISRNMVFPSRKPARYSDEGVREGARGVEGSRVEGGRAKLTTKND